MSAHWYIYNFLIILISCGYNCLGYCIKPLNVTNVAEYVMGTHCMMFEVHHRDTFIRQYRINYVGADVSNYPNPYDGNKLNFSDIDDIWV
jgi:hypothetical protein